LTAPVQYGERIGAFVLYLLYYQLLPEKRLAALMADLFGVPLVTATIARISQDCAQRFHGFVAAVRDHVTAAPVKHLDETGFRIGSKTQWLHVASTMLLTFYRVAAKRGSLLADLAGVVVHDHWKPYYTLKGVLYALCNAHHLRELKALVEIEQEDWEGKWKRSRLSLVRSRFLRAQQRMATRFASKMPLSPNRILTRKATSSSATWFPASFVRRRALHINRSCDIRACRSCGKRTCVTNVMYSTMMNF
jgi:hypothetical protein